jgi:hypothetical protein
MHELQMQKGGQSGSGRGSFRHDSVLRRLNRPSKKRRHDKKERKAAEWQEAAQKGAAQPRL